MADAKISPSRAVKLCGTETMDPPSRRFVAGSLTAELENGQLRYVTFGGVEAIRGIAYLVRDENWGTYTPQIDSLEIEESADRFVVSYRAICADPRQRLVYEAKISGSSDGSLTFAVVATPETDVVTNRTGFVVLHSAGLAGQKVRVTHVDDRVVETHFPDRISPSQPIFDIRALAHEVSAGLVAECRMEGDTFEMEDQRNWGDASYKTYVRPLSLPWGYTLTKGSRIEQAVRLSFSGMPARGETTADQRVTVQLGDDRAAALPEIGLGLPPEEAPGALIAAESLARLNSRFLIGRIDARDGRGLAQLDAYRNVSAALRAPLVMEIVIPDDIAAAEALTPIGSAITGAGLRLDAVVVSSAADLKSWQPGAARPEKPSVDEICAAARAIFPGVKLGGGMLSTFTELNRKRPKSELFDYITHTTCSIVHAADDRSVMETLATLPAIIASTRAIIGDKSYRIGPSAIAARDNPYGKGTADNPDNQRVCLTNVDPRHRGLFNAAWTLGYVSACAYGGVQAVAMGAATGPFGFIHRSAAYPQPYFDSIKGAAVYPAFHVLAGLVRGCGKRLVDVRVSFPSRVAAIAWRDGERAILWLANLTAEPVTTHISGLARGGRRLSVIDASSFEQAILAPGAIDVLARPFEGDELTLDAYAAARID